MPPNFFAQFYDSLEAQFPKIKRAVDFNVGGFVRQRSPLTHLHRAASLPLDIAAGVHDGHKGSVPIRHSLDAFNVIAKANQVAVITDEEIEQISRSDGRLENPQPDDLLTDDAFKQPNRSLSA